MGIFIEMGGMYVWKRILSTDVIAIDLFISVSDEDNTWELETDIHPDLIADFERQQLDVDKATSVYSTIDDDPPLKTRKHSSSMRNESSPAKKKKKTSLGTTEKLTRSPPSSSVPVEPRKKIFGVEKGWRVRAVIGAAKQKDSSVIYAVDYVQGSPLLREYVPSEIAHIYIPRELIEFFQRKIVWNAPNEKETKN